jgi:hypothetical protein
MSTFSYNTGVPAANNNPSVDQPEMLVNTASIASIIAVDHVGFGGSIGGGDGRHNQVTFNSNNVPTLPATLLKVFANNQDGNGNNLPNGLSQLFTYSGTDVQSQLQYTLNSGSSAYGSVLLQGGLILKFGLVTGISETAVTVNWATAPAQPFPNVCFGAVASQVSSGNAGSIIATSTTTSTIRLVASAGTGILAYYIAVGM